MSCVDLLHFRNIAVKDQAVEKEDPESLAERNAIMDREFAYVEEAGKYQMQKQFSQ